MSRDPEEIIVTGPPFNEQVAAQLTRTHSLDRFRSALSSLDLAKNADEIEPDVGSDLLHGLELVVRDERDDRRCLNGFFQGSEANVRILGEL